MFPNTQGEIVESKVVETGTIENPIKAMEITFQQITPAPVVVKYTQTQLEQIITNWKNRIQSLITESEKADAERLKYEDLLAVLIK